MLPAGRLTCVLLLAFLCAACAKTSAEGVSGKNPDLAHLGPFDSAVVLVGKLPEEERQLVEDKLTERLRTIGVKVVSGAELAEIAPEERETVMRRRFGTRAPDTILVVQRDTAVERKRYVPPRWSPGYSYPMTIGGTTTWITVPPTKIPGGWVSEEMGLYLAVLRHGKSGETIWAAAVGSQGDARAKWAQVTEEATDEIIQRLIDDGAFEPSAG